MTEPVIISELEMTRKEHPTRWEGDTSQGLYVHIRYHFWRLTVEVDDRIIGGCQLSAEFPGATRHTLSNAGLKQALMGWQTPIYLPF